MCVRVNDMYYWSVPDGLYNPIAFNEETACDELKDPHIVYNDDLDRLEFGISGELIPPLKAVERFCFSERLLLMVCIGASMKL